MLHWLVGKLGIGTRQEKKRLSENTQGRQFTRQDRRGISHECRELVLLSISCFDEKDGYLKGD